MQPWLIALIVVLCFIFVVCPSIIFTIAGCTILKVFKKSTGTNFNVKNVDVSFYWNGPNKALTEQGQEFLKTLEHEDLYVTSFDGLKLHAHLFKNPNKETNKYFIGFHGFKSFAKAEYAPYAKHYIDMGFNLVLVDERAHNLSEGKYLTMGVKERFDVKTWADYIANTYGNDIKIMIQGVSMGAASVCMAAGLDLPKQVIGIISDCAYANIKEMLKYQIKTMSKNMPMWPMIDVIALFIRVVAKANINEYSPLEGVKNAKVPMVFFHGEKDQMVPVKFAHQLYEACNTKKAIVINPNANHGETMAYEKDNYFDTIKKTFDL